MDTNEVQELLPYWIKERYNIYLKKQAGWPKPWSEDSVFRHTYFCNVHRENDTVSKWIRDYYAKWVGHGMFEYNIILSRFLNWPKTLQDIGYQVIHHPVFLESQLEELARHGKIWGNAYVITTHGIPMPKARYLCQNVLAAAYEHLEAVKTAAATLSCAATARALEGIEGVGSFLAAQIVADLKNTTGHSLAGATDWWTFARPGPGSLRGASWFFYGEPKGINEGTFTEALQRIRDYIDYRDLDVPKFCNQDLQNCLCEFDKYMRVKTGTGRSKRSYRGY